MVHVRAYDKQDGTHVRAHQRSAPSGAAVGGVFGGFGLVLALCLLWMVSHSHLIITVPQPHGAPALRLPAATVHGGSR